MYSRIQVGLVAVVLAVIGGLHLAACARRAAAGVPEGSIVFRVDLNNAAAAELELLPGIGPKRAAAIIVSRESAGPFRSAGDLARIKGIGPATVAGLSPYAMTGIRQ